MGRLNLAFTSTNPNIDESRRAHEPPADLVIRLSEAKALAVATSEPLAIIIGSDQMAVLDGKVLGKPGSPENALQQLQQMSGNSVRFYTGICVLNAHTGSSQSDCVLLDVHFRTLSAGEIKRYLEIEQPYNCAGSFKSEQLGISLIDKMEGHDPTALIGLPLIRLGNMLRQEGYNIP